MTLAADIHIGTRSLFMYLLGGVVRGVDEAMREP
jgi:HlyD family secretion protein